MTATLSDKLAIENGPEIARDGFAMDPPQSPATLINHGQIDDRLHTNTTDIHREDARVPNIAVIDPRSMLRECVVRFITNHNRQLATGFATMDDMIGSSHFSDIALVVLYAVTSTRHTALDDLAKLKSERISCPVVVLVDTSDCGFVRELLQNGARGVVPTVFQANVVLEAIGLVLAGGTFAPVESFMAVQQYNAIHPNRTGGGLTAREAQIVELLRSGKPNKQIAFELDLSLGTVKVHLHNIMKKLGAHNRLQVLANKDAAF
jgi:DNA-binding NarL/FixJ family response regulator